MCRGLGLGAHAGEAVEIDHRAERHRLVTQALEALHEPGAGERACRDHVVNGGARCFHTLGQRHFLLARQQRMLRHVPQVEADRIGGVLGKRDVAARTSSLSARRGGAIGVGDGARRDFKGGHYDCPRITNSIPPAPAEAEEKNNSHATETNVAAPPSICGPVYVTKFRHSYFRSVNGGPFRSLWARCQERNDEFCTTQAGPFCRGPLFRCLGQRCGRLDPGQRRLDNLRPRAGFVGILAQMAAPRPAAALPLEQSCHVPRDGIQRCPLDPPRLNVRQHPADHIVAVDLQFVASIETPVDLRQRPRDSCTPPAPA